MLLLLYTLFIVEIKTGKMPNNIGPTVNNMLKDIVEKKMLLIVGAVQVKVESSISSVVIIVRFWVKF